MAAVCGAVEVAVQAASSKGRSTRLERIGDPLCEPACDFGLGQAIPMFDAGGGDEMDSIGFTPHDVARNVVGDNPVGALAGPFCGGVFDYPLGFGGEADDELRTMRILRKRGEDVGVL